MGGMGKEHMNEKSEIIVRKVSEMRRYIEEKHNLTMAKYLYDECNLIYPELIEVPMHFTINCKVIS